MRDSLLKISKDVKASVDVRRFAAWEAFIINRRIPKLSKSQYKHRKPKEHSSA
jgi:hypothetical protein